MTERETLDLANLSVNESVVHFMKGGCNCPAHRKQRQEWIEWNEEWKLREYLKKCDEINNGPRKRIRPTQLGGL